MSIVPTVAIDVASSTYAKRCQPIATDTMMKLLPRIETERLILRVPEYADPDRWAELMADDEATRYIGGSLPRAMVSRGLMCMIGAWHATGVSMFSVERKDTREWIGRIGPWQPDG